MRELLLGKNIRRLKKNVDWSVYDIKVIDEQGIEYLIHGEDLLEILQRLDYVALLTENSNTIKPIYHDMTNSDLSTDANEALNKKIRSGDYEYLGGGMIKKKVEKDQ